MLNYNPLKQRGNIYIKNIGVKKVVRLSETDIENLVKKIINENDELDWAASLVKEKPSTQSLIGYLNSFLIDTYYRFSIVDTDFVHILGPSSVSDRNGDTEYLHMWTETFNLKSVEKELKNIIKVFKTEYDDFDEASLDIRNCVLILNKLKPAFNNLNKNTRI